MHEIKIIFGDITKLEVDCIVNAANNSLLGGGGVDGAIHKAAGIELLKKCKTLGGCETGKAKITSGFNLPAKYIIHTVGPRFSDSNKEIKLSNCYKNTILLANEYNIKQLAFPCISTGVYGYPFEEACNIALKSISETIKNTNIETIFLVCFSNEDFEKYNTILSNNKLS